MRHADRFTARLWSTGGGQSWRRDAACRDADWELFHPTGLGETSRYDDLTDQTRAVVDEARAYCKRCPVKDVCLADAVGRGDTWAVVGDTLPAERRALIRELDPKHVAKQELVGRIRELAGGGWTDPEIAREVGHPVGRVKRLRQEYGIRPGVASGQEWTASDVSTLRRMAGEGYPDEQIAAALGRTRTAVRLARERTGIAPGVPQGRPLAAAGQKGHRA